MDNNSEPEEVTCLKNTLPSKNLLLNKKNLGYAGGNNIGIKMAINNNAGYVWILNPDIRIGKETLSHLLKTMNEDKELAAVGPRILRREDKETIFTDGEKLFFDEKCTTEHINSWLKDVEIPGKKNYDVDYIDGSCILIRTDAIKEIGMLPEKYFLYFEETHWCVEAKRLGWKLAVNSNAKVFNLTSEKKETFHYYFMRNRLLFCEEFHENFKMVRRYYGILLYKELMNRLKKKSYLKPYFKSRLFGYLSGVLKTL